jgi:Domain of unknown function (DUF1992)
LQTLVTQSGPGDNVVVMEFEPANRHETLPERLIREAMEEGVFDDLPGEGKPIPGAGEPDDDLWWVRAWLERNRDESSE